VLSVCDDTSDQHVQGSPFMLVVAAGAADAASCIVYGDGITEPIAGGDTMLYDEATQQNALQQFTIRARDVHGNRYTTATT
jgi:hypothetical protein